MHDCPVLRFNQAVGNVMLDRLGSIDLWAITSLIADLLMMLTATEVGLLQTDSDVLISKTVCM